MFHAPLGCMTTTITLDAPVKEDHCIKVCNSLLRGELSAIETYRQAIDKFDGEPGIAQLRSIEAEHKRSAFELREHVLKMGGAPEIDSGAWGTLTHAVQSTANFFGEESAVRSLSKGEMIGKAAYEAALNDDGVMPDAQGMIRDCLLPRTMNHIASLDAISAKL